MAEIKYVSQENLVKILGKVKETYVAKEAGKGLSTNDLTNDLLAKINGIEEGANKYEHASHTARDMGLYKVQVDAEGHVSDAAAVTKDDIVGLGIPAQDTTYNEFSLSNSGLVPAPMVLNGESRKLFLRADGSWETPVVAEENLDSALAEKVNAAAEGNHSHANKGELDLIVSGDKAKWDAAAANTATLIGEDANKSVRTIANEELAAQLVAEGAKESLDTLGEIAAWIQSHPDDASAMNAAITALQKQVQGIDAGEGTVKKYVDDAITALSIGDYAKAADLTALAGRVTTLEGASHSHTNKDELDLIESGDKAKWDAVAADYVKASEMVAYTDDEIDQIWASIQ